MSIITSFVNVIAGASVLLGGKAFMDERIGGDGPPLRKAIGAPLLGIGALGIAVSYVRNKRVREDKKAESDFYEAELYEADGWTEKIGAGRKAYCGTCERLIQQSTRIYVNDSNGDIECADCYEYQQEAETFCASKNCGCGQDPCKTYGAETFEAMSTDKEWTIIVYEYADGMHSYAEQVVQRGEITNEELQEEVEEMNEMDGGERITSAYIRGYLTADEWKTASQLNLNAETFEAMSTDATPYGESDNQYPVRIIVGGPPHSGKSTLMNLLEDKMNQYGVDVELRDLDFSSPTNLKAGFDPNRETKDWDEDLARDAANYFREDSEDKIVLGDSIGLISQINEIVSEPADVAILLVSGSKDQFDQSFRNALAKWKSYYEFIDLPILMIIRSSMNPNEMNYFDPHDNYGVIVGLDRDAYGEGTPQDNEISLENACLEGMVFEIAQEYDLELANRNTDKHIDTISEKWPNIQGKPTWNPIDAGKPHLGKIEDDYFSTFDERRKAKAMSAENYEAEIIPYTRNFEYLYDEQPLWKNVDDLNERLVELGFGRNEYFAKNDIPVYGIPTWNAPVWHNHYDKGDVSWGTLAGVTPQDAQIIISNIKSEDRDSIERLEYNENGREMVMLSFPWTAEVGMAMSAESFAVENDPDFDKVKADRNKDGEISDWEQSVGNAVAKGIREHGGKTPKATSMSDMERYMNVRWSKYTPSQKRDWFLMDLNFGHSNKNTKRYFKKGYEYGWNRAREDAGDGELLYMVARSKDLINSSIRKNGMFYDSGAWAGFEDSWRTYEGDEPIYMNNRY